jgi:hypothetical protein
MAGEKVGVAEPPARQRTLEQLHALRLFGKVFEGHAAGFIGSIIDFRQVPSANRCD